MNTSSVGLFPAHGVDDFAGQREMAIDEKPAVRLYFQKLCRRAMLAFRFEVGVQEAGR